MKIADLPSQFTTPFAVSAGAGYKRSIPATPTGTPGQASLDLGFPPDNFNPVSAGGVPPFGQDFNGLFNQVTAWNQWTGAGGTVPFDSGFATAIGGYPQGAIVSSNVFGGFYLSTADDNAGDPNSGAPNWIPFFPYGRKALTQDTNFYVATTGNDNNDGLSALTPWLTLQHAWDFIQSFVDLAGFTATVNIADGTYAGILEASGPIVGQSDPNNLVFKGNLVSPSNVLISTTDTCVQVENASLRIRGMKLTTNNGGCILASASAVIRYDLVNFGAVGSGSAHITADGGTVYPVGNSTASASASFHWFAENGGRIEIPQGAASVLYTFTGTPTFTAFANSFELGIIYTATGLFSTTGAISGAQYLATLNGVINRNGNTFPGTAGSTNTGGQVQ